MSTTKTVKLHYRTLSAKEANQLPADVKAAIEDVLRKLPVDVDNLGRVTIESFESGTAHMICVVEYMTDDPTADPALVAQVREFRFIGGDYEYVQFPEELLAYFKETDYLL